MVPLKELDISVNIIDFVSEVTIRQKFVNEEKDPIEAVYEFELEDKAAVSGFFAEIDGKKLKGICKEKEAAKDDYDDAIGASNGLDYWN